MALVFLVPLAGCSLFRPTLKAHRVFTMPKPNQLIETRGVWAKAQALRLTLTQPRTGLARPAEIRAIHDGASICFLVQWPDRTGADLDVSRFQERRMWVWDSNSAKYYLREYQTDMLAFKFTISGADEACMMTGEAGVYDVWEWRDGWSHVFGRAEDRRLDIQQTPPQTGEYSTYPSNEPGQMIYLQWHDDVGRKPYVLRDRPRSFESPITYGIRAAEPSGSAGDVLAEGVYENYTHSLEVMRALETGHDDDYQFKGNGPHALSIAVTDEDEKEGHYTSPLIHLYLN